MRTPPPLAVHVIADAVREAHHIEASVYTFVRGGEAAWQFNVAGPSGAYRLKIYVEQSDIDQRAAATYHLLHTDGITNVVAPLPLPDGSFTFDIGGYRAALFPYVLAAPFNINTQSDVYGYEIGRVLAAVHAADLGTLPIPVETFRTDAADALQRVLDALPQATAGTHGARRSLAEMLLPVCGCLEDDIALLRQTAAEAQAADLPFVVCHGDPSPANILIGDGIYLIDWDDMRLAPKEIDLMHFRPDSPVLDGYRAATGIDEPDALALRYARALWNAEDIAGFAGRALFHDLSPAQFEHNIATLRNILLRRGII